MLLAGTALFVVALRLDRRANRDIGHRVVEPPGETAPTKGSAPRPENIETSGD